MAGNFKITTEGGERVDEFAREHSEKLQLWARQVVGALYMLVRSVKLYDPDNAIFAKPLELLRETINLIIAKDGQLALQIVKESFYLNNMLVKVDIGSLENIRQLVAAFKDKQIGGFTLLRPITVEEIKNFVWIFTKDQQDDVDEDGVKGRKLVALKVVKWAQIQEKIKDIDDQQDDQKIDRKKYALTVYARTVFFLKKYLDDRAAGKKPSAGKAGRLIQDLVDISFEQRTHFLGMTTFREESEYLIYHSVNVCLLSIVFGVELGLTKPQLRDLGMAALFHDVGQADLPKELAEKRGALTPEEREIVNHAHLSSIRAVLSEGGLSRSAILRLVTTFEHRQDFGSAVKDARGNIQMILPKGQLSLFSRILAVTAAYDALTSKRPYRDAYGPDVALLLMWTELRHKFDPELLKVFMKVMAIQPIKVLPKYQQTVALS
ncbi:MAG: HD-GYP domain-containing protein [Deltaproteobacteria bacterium]